MPNENAQPDDLSLEQIQAIEERLEAEMNQRSIEDEWFGETNALATAEELDETGQLNIAHLRNGVRENLKAETESVGNPSTAEGVIDDLQDRDILPMSLHTPTLVQALTFLTEKLRLRVRIDGKYTIAPSNAQSVDLTSAGLSRFLRRGAFAGSFVGALLIAGPAFAQELKPGMDFVNDPEFQTIAGSVTEDVWHPEMIVGLLVLLGVSAIGIKKLYNKWKANKPYKEKKKEVKQTYAQYETAVKAGDSEAVKKSKAKVVAATMSEVPAAMDTVNLGELDLESEELEEALKWKKIVDKALGAITLEVEKAMVLPKKLTIKKLNKQKHQVHDLLNEKLKEVIDLYNEVLEAYNAISNKNSYLKHQLNIELKKLHYYMKYLEMMQKKWLIFIQNSKNQIIHTAKYTKLDAEDQLIHDIGSLKNDLNDLLNKQNTMNTDEFNEHLGSLQSELDRKFSQAKDENIPGYTEDAEYIEGDSLKLYNNGKYNSNQPIHYELNTQEYQIPLPEGFEVQMWITSGKQIKMNLNVKGNLYATENLHITKPENLIVTSSGQTLQEYIEDKTTDEEVAEMPEASLDIAPENEETLGQIAAAVSEVNAEIGSGKYKLFGKEIEADDDAIVYHQIRVHKESYKGKPRTVVRFRLSEKYWKKALAALDKDPSIPKHTVNFNYEAENGYQKNVNQPMRRFNIVTGENQQATVLVPSTNQLRALAGEVRIMLDPEARYSDEAIREVLAIATQKLSLTPKFVPVTEEARSKEYARLQEIRKDKASVQGKQGVNPEYSAAYASQESINELQSKGLHSVYHQFSDSKLESVFQNGQLFSTTTRWAKGQMTSGMSSMKDMATGGATEVFTRIHTKTSAKNQTWYGGAGKPALVFAPTIFKRMDCYCYTSDQYGSKKPGTFSQRVSPGKLVDIMSQSYNPNNEVMFHDAVAVQEAAYLVCNDPKSYIARLKKIGVTEIGGKPLSEAVITSSQFSKIKNI